MFTQELLQKVWQQGWFWETKTTQPTRATQPVIRANSLTHKGAKHLEKYGSITGRDVSPWANSPTDDTWETGQSGKRYKRYWWTGKTLEGKNNGAI